MIDNDFERFVGRRKAKRNLIGYKVQRPFVFTLFSPNLGYVVEFSQAQCQRLFPAPGIGVRAVLLLAGLVILSLSSALYFTADLGVSTYDAVALVWSERQTRIPFQLCRIITDSMCVIAGAALCLLAGMGVKQILGSVGIGTVITAFFMGPLIAFFNRTVARPLLKETAKEMP